MGHDGGEQYGDTAAKFGIYGSWWFDTLGAVLALNATCADSPPPLETRTLGLHSSRTSAWSCCFLGCLVSRRHGVEATVAVAERQSTGEAYKGLSQYLELGGQQHFLLAVAADGPAAQEQKPIIVPFTPGPFNWEDYETPNWLGFPGTWPIATGA